MVIIFRSFVAMGALTLLSVAAYAGSAPKELWGKSIILTWGELRFQRNLPELNFRNITDALSRKIYISTKGQWFDRFASHQDARDSIGASVRRPGGGGRDVQFTGRTITMTGAGKGGIARKITIEFNESFTTCEAHIIFAKPAGSDVVTGTNMNTRRPMEIRSATVGSVSCSVRDGNVFGQ
jgi:hypothetical protein